MKKNPNINPSINTWAGKIPTPDQLINIQKLLNAYYEETPNPLKAAERVQFGTSGHRGSSLNKTFNENHILAITQAICLYRKEQDFTGPLFIGMDTHALSKPALKTALEVLAANKVTVMLSYQDEYTPTPAISHAIICHNRGKKEQLADGIVITPSHNPPSDGGFKYNPPNGGPASTTVTSWIQDKANQLLENKLEGIKRIPFESALEAKSTKRFNYLENYVKDLGSVIDMEVIRKSKIRIGVDPLGGAGVHYWKAIADFYDIHMEITNETIDPTFSFMHLDWDGKIRMDPSSSFAMKGLIAMKDRFDISFACDTDYDRHGIVTKSVGLLPPNHYLAVAIYYLFQERGGWQKTSAVGKTIVSTQMIDKVTSKLKRKLYEVPVGFKWFAEGLLDGSLGFGGEESAGASFLKMDGTVWTTDKDGIILALLAAEIRAKIGKDPGEIYQDLTAAFGTSFYDRVEAVATAAEKKILKNLSPQNIKSKKLAGEEITAILTKAPGNGASIEGVKVVTEKGWFAARPSGTEDLYKIYGESFVSDAHLRLILKEAEKIVIEALSDL